MNIHINKNTRFQSWNKQTVFNEYPLYIKPGTFTVSLLFHDAGSIRKLAQMLDEMLIEIETNDWTSSSSRFGEAHLTR